MRRKYLREIDRDIAEEETLETERITDEFERWLEKGLPLSELNKDVEAGVDGGPEAVSPSRGLQGVIPAVQGDSEFIAAPDPASTYRDGYDENDPYDRLRSEGGHLGE